MYLSILLIIVACLVFYNEIDLKRMNIGEIILMALTFIVIVVAAVNYMKLTGNNITNEGFSNEGMSSSSNHKKRNDKDLNERIGMSAPYSNDLIKVMDQQIKTNAAEHDIEITSPKQGEYLDPEIEAKKLLENHNEAKYIAPFSNISTEGVKTIDNLLKNPTIKPNTISATGIKISIN